MDEGQTLYESLRARETHLDEQWKLDQIILMSLGLLSSDKFPVYNTIEPPLPLMEAEMKPKERPKVMGKLERYRSLFSALESETDTYGRYVATAMVTEAYEERQEEHSNQMKAAKEAWDSHLAEQTKRPKD